MLDLLLNGYSEKLPIVIQGNAETNKSQLVREFCDLLCQRGRIANYSCRNSWDVLDNLIQALCDHRVSEWKAELLSSEIIIIEDFQYIKEQTVIAEELYKIFKSSNIPIIITTSIPITKENFYCEDLVAFLNQGVKLQYSTA